MQLAVGSKHPAKQLNRGGAERISGGGSESKLNSSSPLPSLSIALQYKTVTVRAGFKLHSLKIPPPSLKKLLLDTCWSPKTFCRNTTIFKELNQPTCDSRTCGRSGLRTK